VSQGGGTLAVVAGSEAVALVDTQSFRVSDPPEPGEPTSSEPAEERGEFVAWLSSVRPAPSSRSAGWS
jgi:hypothetical protein